jgi:hypothetical protein
MKKLILAFCVVALSVASAKTYAVKFLAPSTINGTELAPGDYRIKVEENSVVVSNGKQAVTALVRVETVEKPFDKTSIRYQHEGGKLNIKEIRLGGTNTKLMLN